MKKGNELSKVAPTLIQKIDLLFQEAERAFYHIVCSDNKGIKRSGPIHDIWSKVQSIANDLPG